MANPVLGESIDPNVAAVTGKNKGSGGIGVLGICDTGNGVRGKSTTSKGVVGESTEFHGVFGTSENNVGVAAVSQRTEAMNALSHSPKHAAIIAINDADGMGIEGRSGGNVGVFGNSNTGRGVMGISNTNLGVSGESQLFPGVRGHSVRGRGTEGFSDTLEGVVGISKVSTGVLGISEAGGVGVSGVSGAGVGIFGKGGRLAGFFEGDVEVTGDIRLANADCAEDFDVAGAEFIEPGTVMVLGEEGGALQQSRQAYDKRVAGVVSGAGGYKPGIVLDKQDTQANRVPLALLGKVYCKVDATYGPIEVGDLLTTSDRPGHAMKAADPLKAFGSIIGKALRPFKEGQGLIPILIALQ
jgi:hypothetical protein